MSRLMPTSYYPCLTMHPAARLTGRIVLVLLLTAKVGGAAMLGALKYCFEPTRKGMQREYALAE